VLLIASAEEFIIVAGERANWVRMGEAAEPARVFVTRSIARRKVQVDGRLVNAELPGSFAAMSCG
jgi:hypothetical protein